MARKKAKNAARKKTETERIAEEARVLGVTPGQVLMAELAQKGTAAREMAALKDSGSMTVHCSGMSADIDDPQPRGPTLAQLLRL